MRFTAILAALAAHGALAAPAPAAAPEAAAAAPEVVGAPLEARGKYTTAVSFGTFSDAGCSSGQSDHISADGECNHLPGQGLKIWWLAEGCRVLIGSCSQSNPLWYYADANKCIDISNVYSYQVYC
jgi:hypothetical protein